MIEDLIINLAISTKRDPAREYALTIADVFEAHTVGLAFIYDYALPGHVLGAIPAEVAAQAKREYQEAVDAAVDAFHAAAKRSLLSAEHIVDTVFERDAPLALANAARRFDLSVITQSEPGGVNNDRLIEGLLFESGRPVIVVPYIQRDALKLDRVVCCWDGSRPAARAINDALPFLTKAGAVDLLIVVNEKTKNDEHEIRGVRMGEHLARHNLNVEVQTRMAPDIDVTSTILSHAADSGATMIVMGAYGHSRVREFILGGATRGILTSMTVPVLMSH
jgi:nucleotide-binding universal stress UspA family protein